MRWSAAIENWHRIHYDQPFATQHDGLPGIIVAGSWKQQILARALTEWVGPDGWLASLVCQFRGTNVVGDQLTASGRVIGLHQLPTFGLAYCDVGLHDQKGRVSTIGQAVVALPFRGGPPLPDPFPDAPLPPAPGIDAAAPD